MPYIRRKIWKEKLPKIDIKRFGNRYQLVELGRVSAVKDIVDRLRRRPGHFCQLRGRELLN